jgi:hypothetical protein
METNINATKLSAQFAGNKIVKEDIKDWIEIPKLMIKIFEAEMNKWSDTDLKDFRTGKGKHSGYRKENPGGIPRESSFGEYKLEKFTIYFHREHPGDSLVHIQELLNRFGNDGDYFKIYYNDTKEKTKEMKLQEKDNDSMSSSNGYTKLNTILYGPPGTGKTYNTAIYAVAIIEKKSLEDITKEMEDNQEAVRSRFNGYTKAKKIVFTTFHQSYGYEEFIEGIKPVLKSDGNEKNPAGEVSGNSSEINYEIANGVFKEFCGMPKKNQENMSSLLMR